MSSTAITAQGIAIARFPARAKRGHPRPERVDDDIARLAQL